MEIKFLADREDAIPQIAQWYFDQWGHKTPGNSAEATIERLHGNLNRDKPPIHVLAEEAGEILGCAQLKFHEMDIYPDKEHWLGSVYVPEIARGRGIASALAEEIAARARSFGIETLYLQTERPDGGLYARLGWEPVGQVRYKGEDVLVMEKTL